jgi:hypothetical protein
VAKGQDYAKLNVSSFFEVEAKEMVLASEIADSLHKAKDIRASGNEVEIVVRSFFNEKLPNRYYISNGHIVDNNLTISPQMDIIIADNFRSPILYRTRDSTEFITYESVYAIGEIKKKFDDGHVEIIVETIKEFKNNIKRDPVEPNFLDVGSTGLRIDQPTTIFPYKNPLFWFYMAVDFDGSKFKLKTLQEIVKDYSKWPNLPNIFCILKKGVILCADKGKLKENKLSIALYPEFVDGSRFSWYLYETKKESETLAMIYYLLNEHLRISLLKQPDIMDYLFRMYNPELNNIHSLNH